MIRKTLEEPTSLSDQKSFLNFVFISSSYICIFLKKLIYAGVFIKKKKKITQGDRENM